MRFSKSIIDIYISKTHITTFDILKFDFNAQKSKHIRVLIYAMSKIGNCQHINKLSLFGVDLEDNHLKEILQSLSTNKFLKRINLCGNDFTTNSKPIIKDFLCKYKRTFLIESNLISTPNGTNNHIKNTFFSDKSFNNQQNKQLNIIYNFFTKENAIYKQDKSSEQLYNLEVVNT